MGKARNCIYTLDDETDQFARNVTWKDLIAGDEQLEEMMRNTGYKSGYKLSSRKSSIEVHRNDPTSPAKHETST